MTYSLPPPQANCSKAFTGGYKLPEDDGDESNFENKVKSKEAVSTCESLQSSGMEVDVIGKGVSHWDLLHDHSKLLQRIVLRDQAFSSFDNDMISVTNFQSFCDM